MSNRKGHSVTSDAKDGFVRLWTLAAFLTAMALLVVIMFAVEFLWPSPVELAGPNSEESTALWAILWIFLFVGFLFYELRRSLWRPYWAIDRLALSPAQKWRSLRALLPSAAVYGLMLGVVASPISFDFESGWIVLLLVPTFFYWEWLERRRAQIIQTALTRSGLEISLPPPPPPIFGSAPRRKRDPDQDPQPGHTR